MENKLVDNVYTMIKKWDETHFSYNGPEIVMICSPEYYFKELRGKESDRIHYIRTDPNYQIEFISIIGIKIPVIVSNELNECIEYQLMFRKEYEELEKERLYKKFYAMFCER